MLEVRELTKYYNRRAVVERVSFSINPHEIVAYLGPNGAGKSTTVKMVVGLVGPSHGEILFAGCRIQKHLIEYKMRLGYVPEEAVLYSHLSGARVPAIGGTSPIHPGKAVERQN